MGHNPNRAPQCPIPAKIDQNGWLAPTPKWDLIGFDPQPVVEVIQSIVGNYKRNEGSGFFMFIFVFVLLLSLFSSLFFFFSLFLLLCFSSFFSELRKQLSMSSLCYEACIVGSMAGQLIAVVSCRADDLGANCQVSSPPSCPATGGRTISGIVPMDGSISETFSGWPRGLRTALRATWVQARLHGNWCVTFRDFRSGAESFSAFNTSYKACCMRVRQRG